MRRLWYLAVYWFGLGGFAASIVLVHPLAWFCALLPRRLAQRFAARVIGTYFRVYIDLLNGGRALRSSFPDWPEDMLRKGCIVVANHPSRFDAPLLLSRLPRAFCVFKQALRRNALLGLPAEAIGYISNAHAVDGQRQAISQIRAGGQLIVFPEGTRTEPGTFEELHGFYAVVAKVSNAPVHVLRIDTDSDVLSKQHQFWREPKLPAHISLQWVRTFHPKDFALARDLHRQVSLALAPSMNQTPDFDPLVCAMDSAAPWRFRVPADSTAFDGHFPGNPIAPGALVLHWMASRAHAEGLPTPGATAKRVRFLREVRPGDIIEVRASMKANAVACEVHANGELTASAQFPLNP